jgi:hypothetical protein
MAEIYQDQVYAVKRQTQTLSLEAFFAIPELNGKIPDNPLESKAYSRARLTIIDKTKKPNGVVFANIPESDIAYIKMATDIALGYCLAPTVAPTASTGETSVAYSQRLLMGTHKGKTPMQLLGEPNGKKTLEKEREFLYQNLEKHPVNKRVIDAIDQALAAKEDEMPAQESVNNGGIIEIYRQEHKFLSSQKDSEGRCLVYCVLLQCELARKYPFSVNIKNAYAPVKTTGTGSANVQMSEAVGNLNFSMNLTKMEFVTLVSKMAETKDNYVAMHFAERYAAKERIGAERRKAAKAHTA